MHDVRPEQYASVIREMIRNENDVTNYRIMFGRPRLFQSI
jgi:hypothetical protein